MAFQLKRVYEPAVAADGARVLVDRLWPRGVSKAKAVVSVWLKDVAPTVPLRLWFGHKPERFAEFRRRYLGELVANPALGELRKLGRAKRVTLLYAAHDPKVNHAVVLLSALRGKASSARPKRAKKSAAPAARVSRR